MRYVVTHPQEGFWYGNNWGHRLEDAKHFETEDELMAEMKAKGCSRIKLIIIEVAE